MDLGLERKTAWVSGGSRGIGKAIALELAGEGVDVAISARTESDLEAAAAEIRGAAGRRVVYACGDTRVVSEVNAMADSVLGELGRVDILVNCAARPGGYVHDLEPGAHELLREDLDTKVVGYLRCIEAVAPRMKEQRWGRIVNIGGLASRSSASLSGMRNLALVHLGKTLSDQLGAFGITVNTVHPGATRTERTTAEDAERVDNAIHRIVDAREIGWLVAFLCSDKASAVTGESIAAGGGVGHSVHP